MGKSPSRGAIPWGLLGMLAMVVAIERSWIGGNLALANGLGHGWSETARQLKKVAWNRDVLCFGDSRVKCGLLPGVIHDRTGRSAYNLAVIGGSATSSYILLRRALAAGARPSIIVVDFDREILAFEPESKTHALPWADLANLRESAEFCSKARAADLFTWITLARLVPSVKDRHGIRAYVVAKLRGENPNWDTTALQLRRNWNINLGALANVKEPFQDFPPPPVGQRRTGTWRPHPTNLHFLHRFLELARQNGITVAWLMPPVSPGTQMIWESWGDEEIYDALARSALDRYPNLVVVDGRHAGYEASVFHDAVHLDRDGAEALSSTVADLLRRGDLDRTEPSRWIALPSFRRAALTVPLEDLGQSGVVVRQKLAMKDKMRR